MRMASSCNIAATSAPGPAASNMPSLFVPPPEPHFFVQPREFRRFEYTCNREMNSLYPVIPIHSFKIQIRNMPSLFVPPPEPHFFVQPREFRRFEYTCNREMNSLYPVIPIHVV